MYLFLGALVFITVHGFSLAAGSRSYSLAAVCRLLIAVASLAVKHRLWRLAGCSSCGPWAQWSRLVGSRAQAP